MDSRDRVLVFLKAPHPGSVKTRLAAVIGSQRACAVYRQLAEMQVAAADKCGGAVEIHYTPRSAEAEMRVWLGEGREYFAQTDGDLGVRLRFAMLEAFARGARRVALVGGDCPALDAKRIELAFDRMEPVGGKPSGPVVFGPARDGGFYLVGVSSPITCIFEDIPWSSGDTLRSSLSAAVRAGLSVAQLPCEDDVDDFKDWRKAIDLRILCDLNRNDD